MARGPALTVHTSHQPSTTQELRRGKRDGEGVHGWGRRNYDQASVEDAAYRSHLSSSARRRAIRSALTGCVERNPHAPSGPCESRPAADWAAALAEWRRRRCDDGAGGAEDVAGGASRRSSQKSSAYLGSMPECASSLCDEDESESAERVLGGLLTGAPRRPPRLRAAATSSCSKRGRRRRSLQQRRR